jgi:hypothetical protein
LFCGYDPRESAGYHNFCQSVIESTKQPVQFIPLTGNQGDGTNAFTYARFKVPELCGFSGFAIFADAADMLALGDVGQLWELRDKKYALQCVKHDYKTRFKRKYLGTELEAPNEDYPRKNWSSLVIWNCGHEAHKRHRHELNSANGAFLHRFAWLDDEEIGSLPREWNWLADEHGVNKEAKLLHFTTGIPGFLAYRDTPHANEWLSSAERMMRGYEQPGTEISGR